MKHNLKLFEKNINNKFKVLPFLVKKNKIGKIKYFPPFFKEWKNTGFFYNKNNIKNLPIMNLLVNKLIKIYFNLFFKNLKKDKISIKKRNKLLNNIYISKAEIKFTNSISIITIYTLNNLNSIFKKYEKYINYLTREKEWIQKNKYFFTKNKSSKNKYLTRQWPISIIKLLIRPNFFNYMGFKPFYNEKINKNMDVNFDSNVIKVNFNNIKDIMRFNLDFYNKKSELFYLEIIKLRLYNIKKEYFLYLKTIWKYSLVNSSNFVKLNNDSNFILKFKNILSRILNTKIELNIINLKYHSYNPDFITKFLALKLKKNKFNIITSMRNIINKSKIDVAKYNKYRILNNNINLRENQYKDLSLISIVNNKDLTSLLKDIYNTNITINNSILFNNYNKIYNLIFNTIKFKYLGGIRLEIKGRLTKRYRADRSIYKLLWKGGLKNKDSSFKGLSSIVFRGNIESNIMYSITKNKRRIGAFAIKGWISGK